jgi:hypothetical protein
MKFSDDPTICALQFYIVDELGEYLDTRAELCDHLVNHTHMSLAEAPILVTEAEARMVRHFAAEDGRDDSLSDTPLVFLAIEYLFPAWEKFEIKRLKAVERLGEEFVNQAIEGIMRSMSESRTYSVTFNWLLKPIANPDSQ